MKRYLVPVLWIVLLVAGLFSTAGCRETAKFADPNLKAAVQKSIDRYPEGHFETFRTIEGLPSLWAVNQSITDLRGIENCTSLVGIQLDFNLVSDLTPLTKLTKLQTLDLGVNQISDISPLESTTNLTSLNLSWNEISDISALERLTELELLSLQYNRIQDISPLSSLTKLQDLNLSNNQINDISPIIDLPNLKTLTILRGNPLSEKSLNVYIPQLKGRGVKVN